MNRGDAESGWENDGCDDLDLLRVYELLPDRTAEREGMLRVVDESGEDYLYPRDRFVVLAFPLQTESSILAVLERRRHPPANAPGAMQQRGG